MKHFIQFQAACKHCKRPSVDIVSTDAGEGLFYSLHFLPSEDKQLKFCGYSGEGYVR